MLLMQQSRETMEARTTKNGSGKPKQQSAVRICTHFGWHPRNPTGNIHLGSAHEDKLLISIIRNPDNKMMED